LSAELETRGIRARRLDLVFIRVDNIAQAARVGLARPRRAPKHLAKLLAERLVVIDPGFGIETASLTASWVEALTERQTIGRHVGENGGGEVDISQLVDTLGVRLGENKVFRLVPYESASRREASWAIKALRDEALPLFAAADDRDGLLRPEANEPAITLAPMTLGREASEDFHSMASACRRTRSRSFATAWQPAASCLAPRFARPTMAHGSPSPALCSSARCRGRPRA
jgi:hypothetical protein